MKHQQHNNNNTNQNTFYTTLLIIFTTTFWLFCCFPPQSILASTTTTNTLTTGEKLVVVTVATHITDGFLRFNRSVNLYKLKLEVLGLNQQWQGGDITHMPGGGQKIRLLRKYLDSIQHEKDLVILFTDSYDVILTGTSTEILDRFYAFKSKVVFSSEKYCWPDKSLASSYPKLDGKRYLNSGAFIGYVSELRSIVSHSSVENTDDDQLYYTKIYLDPQLRSQFNIKLDLQSHLFQNLNGELNDVEIRFSQAQMIDSTNADAYLYNRVHSTQPIVVHGNGNSKVPLNSLGNYLAKSWHPAIGCLACEQHSRLQLDDADDDDDNANDNANDHKNNNKKPLPTEQHQHQYPTVLIAINILKHTPFLEEFFEDVSQLNYPKEKISIFIQSLVVGDERQNKIIEQFIDHYKGYYLDVRHMDPLVDGDTEWKLRNRYLDEFVRSNLEYLFVWDSEARLINGDTLRTLVKENRPAIAPLLTRPNELWSNFWGALTHDGFYSRSHDYVQIVKNERRGVWNVPHISQVYLINASVFDMKNRVYNYKPLSYRVDEEKISNNIENNLVEHNENFAVDTNDIDPDMYFCALLRHNGIFMYVINLEHFGHLSVMDTYDHTRMHADFYEIHSNEIEWRRRYIHENYTQVLNSDGDSGELLEQPCPDVYWFPIVSPQFCRHLIEIMENFGQWSAGKNYDPRLDGGYENVPTRDIHMKQVGLEQHWLYFLRQYIRPMQEKIFTGYYHDPPKAIMNFVVRYHPDEQANLRPHHDASTYTINIALNRANVDYKGGGCRFVRYNCSITNMRLGWSLIHPGRLTHYHEGLTVTKGVRYIMVSFVDP